MITSFYLQLKPLTCVIVNENNDKDIKSNL